LKHGGKIELLKMHAIQCMQHTAIDSTNKQGVKSKAYDDIMEEYIEAVMHQSSRSDASEARDRVLAFLQAGVLLCTITKWS
jgi:hypothetical protein